jgi:hypothetical protein
MPSDTGNTLIRSGRSFLSALLADHATLILSFFLIPNMALAHGIAGNRYFPGTLTFDDPAVADELVFGYAWLKHPVEDGSLAKDDMVPLTFVRLLTPDIAFGVDTTGIIRNRNGFPQQAVSTMSTSPSRRCCIKAIRTRH